MIHETILNTREPELLLEFVKMKFYVSVARGSGRAFPKAERFYNQDDAREWLSERLPSAHRLDLITITLPATSEQ